MIKSMHGPMTSSQDSEVAIVITSRGRQTLQIPPAFHRELRDLLRVCGISVPSRHGWSVCSAETLDSNEADPAGALTTCVGRVIRFIDENLDAPLSLERMAEEAELSKFHFARTFRKEIGETPWSYVRRARLDRAKVLLKRGEPPAVVAVETGFFDQSHLTRVMKEVEGTTPRRFQEEICQDERKIVQE